MTRFHVGYDNRYVCCVFSRVVDHGDGGDDDKDDDVEEGMRR